MTPTSVHASHGDSRLATAGTWTIGKLLGWTTDYLEKCHSESARLDAEVLLANVLHCPRINLYTRYEEDPGDKARDSYRSLVKQRAAGTPVAYLVGQKEFYSLKFEVSPDVLIPRPDSEFAVLEFLRLFRDRDPVKAVDIGTGCGNLGIAAAHEHPTVRFLAVDISPAALAVAETNAEKNGVADRIDFLQSDLFSQVPPEARFDCVISNPPYIPTSAIPSLELGVRDYEPKLALDGGHDGFQVVRRIIQEAPSHLHSGGYLILEIGADQEHPVVEMLQSLGSYRVEPTVRDYSGHSRVVSAEYMEG